VRNNLANIEAEKSVLGCIMLDNSSLGAMPGLESRHFSSRANAHIFAVIERMAGENEQIDQLTLADRLSVRNELESVGGIAYIGSLTDHAVTARHAKQYAEIVKERFTAREMVTRLQKVLGDLQLGCNPADMSDELADLTHITQPDNVREVTLAEAFDDLESYQLGTRAGLVHTGFDALDRYSPAADELVIIAARPSTGKTALAIEMAERMSRRMPILFLSLEMSGRGIHFRRISYATGLGTLVLKQKSGLSADQYNRVSDAFGRMHENKNLHIFQGSFGLNDMVGLIRSEIARRGIGAFVVDHLGKVRLPGRLRHDIETGEITARLADLCKEHSVLGLVLHQLSRKSEDRDSKRPMMSDLRDSGRLEQDADHVWLLHRPSRYDDEAGNKLEVGIAKNRDGPIGMAELRYTDSGRVVE